MGQTIEDCWNAHPRTVALDIFLFFLFIREFLEFWTRGYVQYLTSMENYLQLLIYSLTATFICAAPIHMALANHVAAWAVFFSCINVTQLFGRIDFFGKGIFMALDVSKEIVKTLLVFVPSIVAFVLAFNIH